MPEWHPIETVPKGRNSFLIYCPESGDVFQAYRFEGESQFRMFNSGGRVIYQTPSHWMLLPEPPEVKEQG